MRFVPKFLLFCALALPGSAREPSDYLEMIDAMVMPLRTGQDYKNACLSQSKRAFEIDAILFAKCNSTLHSHAKTLNYFRKACIPKSVTLSDMQGLLRDVFARGPDMSSWNLEQIIIPVFTIQYPCPTEPRALE
jgi:hypothetical protein